MRKEEKDNLNKEISFLGAKLDYLKHRAGIPDEQSIFQSKLEKALLREILRNQQYLAAGFKSTMSIDMSEHVHNPAVVSLYLGADPSQRQQLLNEIRAEQLCHGKRFIGARTQFVNPLKRSSQSTRLVTKNGDNFATKVDVIPLHHAASVKQVYDAILFHVFNVDICLTEKMNVEIREKARSGDELASQLRVLYTNHSVDVEINSAVFSQFTQSPSAPSTTSDESGTGGECIVTTTFIERDDLYPYNPREFVRQDITSIWMVTRYPANGVATDEAPDDQLQSLEKDDRSIPDSANNQIIVMKRWAQSKLHPSKLDIPKGKLVDLAEDTLCITNAVLAAVYASLQSAPPS
uniref:Uncharacterized protein n=1 Tax=Globisporangium ultimum (strain ATCC 200006 / CBS 805.95 / DAOM BR144) TaxID=431595 RepID=K3WCN5_GLOUD